MPERLVDVLIDNSTLVHTFPVVLKDSEGSPKDEDFQKKAGEAAAFAQVVPKEQRPHLTTRIHPDRGGQLAPFGTQHGVLAETPAALQQCVRERAYSLWERAGRPEGRADEFWHLAHEQHIRERAYVLWEQEGCPEGRADEYWFRTKEFESV